MRETPVLRYSLPPLLLLNLPSKSSSSFSKSVNTCKFKLHILYTCILLVRCDYQNCDALCHTKLICTGSPFDFPAQILDKKNILDKKKKKLPISIVQKMT